MFFKKTSKMFNSTRGMQFCQPYRKWFWSKSGKTIQSYFLKMNFMKCLFGHEWSFENRVQIFLGHSPKKIYSQFFHQCFPQEMFDWTRWMQFWQPCRNYCQSKFEHFSLKVWSLLNIQTIFFQRNFAKGSPSHAEFWLDKAARILPDKV